MTNLVQSINARSMAYWGLAGQIVRTIAKESEAHEMGLLSQLLASFGNIVGRGPHTMVGSTRHGANLFVVNVGISSKARKGTAWGEIENLFKNSAPAWSKDRVQTGLSSGEGLIFALADKPSADGCPISRELTPSFSTN